MFRVTRLYQTRGQRGHRGTYSDKTVLTIGLKYHGNMSLHGFPKTAHLCAVEQNLPGYCVTAAVVLFCSCGLMSFAADGTSSSGCLPPTCDRADPDPPPSRAEAA